MNKRLWWAIVVIVVTLAIGVGVYVYRPTFKPTHYHAGFHVYINGTLKDFSGFEYMTLSPCSQAKGRNTENPQLEKAHLHDGNGDIVHVHREGAKWKDLFTNLKVTLPKNQKVTGYVNGAKVSTILDYPIKAYDSVVIMVGREPDIKEALRTSVTKQRILQVEHSSEFCATGT